MARLSRLLGDLKIELSRLRADREVGAVRTNSLEVSEGDAFICIKGTEHDGHDFICIAEERGASVIIAERMTPYLEEHPELDFVIVENTRLAAAHIWNELCGRPSERMRFIAVTGTNGKTSTTYFLREIFKRAGFNTGIIGTVKCISGDRVDIIGDSSVNSMTTPPPERLYPELQRMAEDGVELVFIEASSHALCQYRLDPIRFELAIFTNLTSEHLDYHGSMESYFKAKLRLLTLSECALVNIDDDWLRMLPGLSSIPTRSYSAFGNADFSARDVDLKIPDGGIAYTLFEHGIEHRIACPIEGSFTVYNTLAAVSAARLFGIPHEIICEAMAKAPQVPGRMERLSIPESLGFEVYIDFAHTPDALTLALKALRLRVTPPGRLIIVFGCGGDRDPSKRPIMGRIASRLSELAVITSDNSRSENPLSIILDIIRGISDRSVCRVAVKRRDAIIFALGEARCGDVVLLAGKGHEDYEIDSRGKHYFSERELVYETIEKAIKN